MTQPKLSNQLLAKLEVKDITKKIATDESLDKLPGHTVSHTLPGSDDQPPGPLGTCTP